MECPSLKNLGGIRSGAIFGLCLCTEGRRPIRVGASAEDFPQSGTVPPNSGIENFELRCVDTYTNKWALISPIIGYKDFKVQGSATDWPVGTQ